MKLDILIAEDCEPIRTFVRQYLELKAPGCVLSDVDNGEAAVEACRRRSPGLIIMDVDLPGISGLAAARQILAESPGVRVVLFTSLEDAEIVQRANALGIRHVIRKSDYRQLLPIIEELSAGPRQDRSTRAAALAFAVGVLGLLPGLACADDALVTSWYRGAEGRYARIYLTTNDQANGTAYTTWSRGTTQALPAYAGVQMVCSSTNWVYIRTSGLGAHTMGPWYLDAQKSQLFPQLPINTKSLFRFPLAPVVPTNKSANGLGAIGYFVDGVAMFNSWDAYYWSGSAELQGGGGSGYWNRDAFVNEGLSFDNAYAHQPQDGMYHYHANVPALRYELGDHVVFIASNKSYAESSDTNFAHSPILGWVSDGHPIYGPYGYSNAMDAESTVIRMRTGYQLRNGQRGTDNLSSSGRSTIPAWAVRIYGASSNTVPGPTVAAYGPLGRYMEDNAFLGDLGYAQGVDFDLDEYNGRFCVTPEFPGGVYAYFVSINSNGLPIFPYNIGRGFHGSPLGGAVASISEPVTTNYLGGADAPPQFSSTAAGGTVTIAWSAVEGGAYRVESSSDLSSWNAIATNSAVTNRGSFSASPPDFTVYRVTRVAVSNYDGVTGTTTAGGSGIVSINPTTGTRGSSYGFTITLAANAPPVNAPVIRLSIGTNVIAGATHPTATTVTGTFSIGGGAATGAQNVELVWPGPPGNPTAYMTNTLPGGFTIQ